DPANYVFCGYDPWKGWQLTKQWTVHFHIKDWVHGEPHGRPAGEGDGRIEGVMAEAVAVKYEGVAGLGAHPLGGGPARGGPRAASRDRSCSPRRSRHSRASSIASARNTSERGASYGSCPGQ